MLRRASSLGHDQNEKQHLLLRLKPDKILNESRRAEAHLWPLGISNERIRAGPALSDLGRVLTSADSSLERGPQPSLGRGKGNPE